MSDKPNQWIGTSKDDLKNFPSKKDIELGKKRYQEMSQLREDLEK